jgi:cytochrome c
MIRCYATGLAILTLCLGASQTNAAGNLAQGQRIFGACVLVRLQRMARGTFLKQATQPGTSVAQQGGSMGGMGGGMGGMTGGGRVPNLKHLDPKNRVQEINHCKDTYTVTTADGQSRKFWERNLRLKTDANADGPEKDAPALVGAGMTGDRADVIFADPSEISAHIATKC